MYQKHFKRWLDVVLSMAAIVVLLPGISGDRSRDYGGFQRSCLFFYRSALESEKNTL